MSNDPTNEPAELTLGEVAAIFPAWDIQEVATGAYTATRQSGSQTRVIAANDPVTLAVYLLKAEAIEQHMQGGSE
jgi:hypothetical protein